MKIQKNILFAKAIVLFIASLMQFPNVVNASSYDVCVRHNGGESACAAKYGRPSNNDSEEKDYDDFTPYEKCLDYGYWVKTCAPLRSYDECVSSGEDESSCEEKENNKTGKRCRVKIYTSCLYY